MEREGTWRTPAARGRVEYLRTQGVDKRRKTTDATTLCPLCQAFIARVNFEKNESHGLRIIEGRLRATNRETGSLSPSCVFCTLSRDGIAEFVDTLGGEESAQLGLAWGDVMQHVFEQERGLMVQVRSRDGKVKLALDFDFDIRQSRDTFVYAGLSRSESVHLPQTAAGRSCYFERAQIPVYRQGSSQHSLAHTVGMIRSWLGKCRIEHPLCHQSNRLWSPTRLLDLGTGDMSDIKLCNRPSNFEPYIALSYCWGPLSGVIQTTKATIAHREVSISYANLPVLFRDAIELTRALGVRFLWIDSLCIIQDDIEDWERESSVMAEVYSNSYLTIAATASTSPHTGLFGKRWTSTPPAPGESPGLRISVPINTATLPIPNDGQVTIRPHLHLAHKRFWDVDNSAAHLHDAPLLSRAWAFQERLLAPYTLHFHAEELVWECRSGVQCECGTLVNSDNSSANPFAKINAGYLKTCFSLATEAIEKVDVGLGRVEVGEVWLFLVSEFCQLRLTYESDRLPALSGLASKLEGQVLGKYFAGVWGHDLVRGLLFESVSPSTDLRVALHAPNVDAHPFTPSRPSWSWASHTCLANQKITYDSVLRFGFHQNPNVSVEKMNFTPGSGNPMSWVSSTDVVVSGLVADLNVWTSQTGVLELSYCPPGDELKAVGILEMATRFTFVLDLGKLAKDNEKLSCLFTGTSDAARGSCFWYVLVLRCVDEEENTFERVGLAKVSNWDLVKVASNRRLTLV